MKPENIALVEYLKNKGITSDGKYIPKEKYELLLRKIEEQKEEKVSYEIELTQPESFKNDFAKKKANVVFKFDVNKYVSKDNELKTAATVNIINLTSKHHLSLVSAVGKQVNIEQALNLLVGKTIGIKDFKSLDKNGEQKTTALWAVLKPKADITQKNEFVFKPDKYVGIFEKKEFKGHELSEKDVLSLANGDNVFKNNEVISVNLTETPKLETKFTKAETKSIKL